ncbi:hypothetical protein AB205_0090660 [Aquarana catesbeiana]|uniref:MADF domain-containing protein n=1 Tax=Aquarana catesbeiana TaxID=8400 RepID=A0A2G9Q6U2_AQUCT|nr:hypothetical protein AB205_0090660 [Aquarana catesbeiana]
MGGVSCMRSVNKANMHVSYVRSLRGGKRNAEDASVRNKENMNKFKDHEFMSHFIDKYREMRNLWEVKHSLYYNKQVRKETLERLLEFV